MAPEPGEMEVSNLVGRHELGPNHHSLYDSHGHRVQSNANAVGPDCQVS